jgi:hypothetical protein
MAEGRGQGGEGVERVSVEQARRDVEAGQAVLVCAYDDESKCRRLRLEGALTLDELRQRAAALPKNREIIFYCA